MLPVITVNVTFPAEIVINVSNQIEKRIWKRKDLHVVPATKNLLVDDMKRRETKNDRVVM
jgi:hypothetical protein